LNQNLGEQHLNCIEVKVPAFNYPFPVNLNPATKYPSF